MDLKRKIKELASAQREDVIAIRQHLHAHPELSFTEHETAKLVSKKLSELGLEVTEGIAGTGLVAIIEGNNPDTKVVSLRADMDALPILEENDLDYRSKNEGVMHACGHDAHTASLLGTASILSQIRDQFDGSVKLIFQPGEEKAPGGASMMIREGVLENPAPASMLGQHVMTFIPVGKVGFREGKYMASADEIYMTIKGKGGHGATPHLNVDPVLITCHIIVALQQIISRSANPLTPTVLSFGKIIAEGATNIIPNEVRVEGTFRALDEDWRAKAHQKMKQIAESIASGMGGSAEFEILKGYPFLENNPELTRRSKKFAQEYLGEENVLDLDVWMASEDFAYYSQQVDSCFYRLGVRNEEKGFTSTVHTPTFNLDEGALEIGCGLMAWIAVNELTV